MERLGSNTSTCLSFPVGFFLRSLEVPCGGEGGGDDGLALVTRTGSVLTGSFHVGFGLTGDGERMV